jgi:hypothetical protein
MRWHERHPLLTLLGINAACLAAAAGLAEIALRIWVPYQPCYYVVLREEPGSSEYPWGTVRRNSLAFPDDEFDLTSPKPRVGYFGDSVTRGVGAGHGYRAQDLLEELRPELEHWTFERAVNGIDEKSRAHILEIAERFELSELVYLMNLNDLLPTPKADGSAPGSRVRALRQHVKFLDELRGHSFLYSALRFRVATLALRLGYGHTGWRAAELFPHQNAGIVRETAVRVADLADAVAAQGRRFLVILLPYEMQISEEAARTYHELGVRWEEGFLERSTQQAIRRELPERVRVLDAYLAFIDPVDEARARAENHVGQYFVYDAGDKLDWNHPNRAGHAKLAAWLAQIGQPYASR